MNSLRDIAPLRAHAWHQQRHVAHDLADLGLAAPASRGGDPRTGRHQHGENARPAPAVSSESRSPWGFARPGHAAAASVAAPLTENEAKHAPPDVA